MPISESERCACCGARDDERRAECAAAEVDRLRNIIGELYVGRGMDRWGLYHAIKQAFRDSRPTA